MNRGTFCNKFSTTNRKFIFRSTILFLFSVVYGQESDKLRAFMEEEIECSRYVFSPGEFPRFKWKNEHTVDNELGKFPLTVTFYNNDFQRVTSPDKSGRYGAVIEGTSPFGFVVRRYVTLFCSSVEFDDYSKNVPVIINRLKDYGIAEIQWEIYKNKLERFSFGNLKYFPQHEADAAIFLAGLGEIDTTPNIHDTPRIRDRQWWITLKQKLEGKSSSEHILELPQKTKDKSLLLATETDIQSSGYDKQKIENLRSVCSTWAERGTSPHVTLVVHKGKIIFHEAFGNDDDGKPITTETPMWMASITKLLTGVLMMEFVDQGIIELDAPVSRYLPELIRSPNEKLTVRHLFTHTSGLHFAGEWASDWNVALENQVAHVMPSVTVGETFSYNRVGYAIAGKIMERMTGRAVPYLYKQYIFDPLGMNTAYSDNTYGGLYCTATDLARLGQALLNKGTYNGIRLFSQKSFGKMLPSKLPVSDRLWGIGTSPRKGVGLSEAAYGHGAASGTIFCVDPINDLIIISARDNEGKSYREFEKAFIESVTALVKGM